MEINATNTTTTQKMTLQGGHDLSIMEIPRTKNRQFDCMPCFNEAMTFRSWKCRSLKHLSHKGQNRFSRAPIRFHLISSRIKRNAKPNSTISPANCKLASGHRCFVTTSPLACALYHVFIVSQTSDSPKSRPSSTEPSALFESPTSDDN